MAIKTKNMHRNNPARYVKIQRTLSVGTTDTTGNIVGTWPYAQPGIVREMIFVQEAAGTGGTSVKVTPKVGSTALCSTDVVFTQVGGVGAASTGTGITKPSGATAPVLATGKSIAKGNNLTVDFDVTGSYDGNGPTVTVIAIIESVN